MSVAPFSLRRILTFLCAAIMVLPAMAQQEADLEDAASSGGVSVIGLHRMWIPDEGYRPNTGLFFETINVRGDRPLASSFMLLATGIGSRNTLALLGGASYAVVGDHRFGLMVAANLGVSFGSNTGLLAFDVITDPSLSLGLAGLIRLGLSVPIYNGIRVSVNAAQSWFSNERGTTPPGIQVGLSIGGAK